MRNSSLLRSSDLCTLNDDEIKRIMAVIERDFKLRQKESKRIEELNKLIRQELERDENLSRSNEFNRERCIRCYKPFRRLFNSKEVCSKCQLYVCQDCATYNKQMKIWTCKLCSTVKELQSLTGEWFYREISKKYKRCGGAKIIRELYKRDKELAEIDELDEDLGYGTLPTNNSTDSKDSGSIIAYVIRDKNIKNELNEYSKRLSLLVDNLKSDLSDSDVSNKSLSTHSKNRESLKVHLQQITSEINRARAALSGPLRRSDMKINVTYENDLRNLLIQKAEHILRMNLQQVQRNSLVNSTNFDQKLAQIIFDKCTNQENMSNSTKTIDSSSTSPKSSPQLQQQSIPPPAPVVTPSFQLIQKKLSPRTTDSSWEMTSNADTSPKTSSSSTSVVHEEDSEAEDDITPVGSSTEDEKSNSYDIKRRFIDTDLETIQKSTGRVDDWKTTFTRTDSKALPSDVDEHEECSTWL